MVKHTLVEREKRRMEWREKWRREMIRYEVKRESRAKEKTQKQTNKSMRESSDAEPQLQTAGVVTYMEPFSTRLVWCGLQTGPVPPGS